MQEYENDRWRIISSKVGAGFSPAACKDKAEEFKAIETAEEEEREQQRNTYGQPQLTNVHADLGAPYQ
jgi:hypothetical protein